MQRLFHFGSSALMAASFLLLTIGTLTITRTASASAVPAPAACAGTCAGCPAAPLSDGSCGVGVSCAAGAGCIGCYCSENQKCACWT